MANGMDQSEATRGLAAATAYQSSIQPTIDDLNKQLNTAVAEMNSKIVAGMTDAEKANLQGRIEQLKTQYADAISRTQGQYAFAEQAAATTTRETQKGLQDVFAAQRALAAQALGTTAVAAPAGYSAQQADAARAAQQMGAASMAAVGGDLSVPTEALVRTPLATGAGTTLEGAPAGGLIGITAGTANLYNQMLQQTRARALTDLESQRIAIEQTIRLTEEQAARKREEEERARVDAFRQQALMNIMQQTASMQDRLAQLQAAAAGADTRTERELAQQALDKLKKEEAIRLQNDLKRIAAQAKASGRGTGGGLTKAEQQAIKDQQNYTVGQAKIGAQLDSGLNAFLAQLATNKSINKSWQDVAGTLVYTQQVGGKQTNVQVDPSRVLFGLTTFLGSVAGEKTAKQKSLIQSYLATGLAPAERAFLNAAYPGSKSGAQYWVDLLSGKTKVAGAPPAVIAAPPGQKPTTPRPTPSPAPQTPPKPPVSTKINPGSTPKVVKEAKSLAEAAKLAESGGRQPQRFALPNGMNVNVFTYQGKTYATPIGATYEIYEWNSGKKTLGKRVR
jgi:hypothetical protein